MRKEKRKAKKEGTGEKSREDYLRTIYELDEGKGVRSVNIAKQLKISKASVSEMLRKLACEGLVKIKPYSKIFLTRKGKREAEKLFDKYYIIKSFIKKFLCYEDDKAREEAHKLEHAFSQDSIETISKILEETQEGKLKPKPNYIG